MDKREVEYRIADLKADYVRLQQDLEKLEYVKGNLHPLEKQLAAAGLPPFVIPIVVGTDRNIRAGYFDVASDAVQRMTGKPPQSVREFLTANRAALRA